MDRQQAASVDRKSFPALINETSGGLPPMRTGQKLIRFLTPNAAQITLDNGQTSVIESSIPIAMPTSDNRWSAINLDLNKTPGGFAPSSAVVSVTLPNSLAAGVSLPLIGVSATPVDASTGASLNSKAYREGDSVLYTNTQADTDTLAKPTTFDRPVNEDGSDE